MPKAAKTSDLYRRFLECLAELDPTPSDDQTKIGAEIKVGQTAVSGWKTGDKKPAIEQAVGLARYAMMCTEYLLTGQGPRRPWWEMDPVFVRLIQCWENLDGDNKRRLLEHAETLINGQSGRFERPKIPYVKLPPVKPPKKPSH